MLHEHKFFWQFIEKFIKDNNIKSVFEVGSGTMPPARKWVTDYTAVDLNESTDAIHDDFTTMSLAGLNQRNYDLFLAAAVIEHCDGYQNFFHQMRKIPFKYAIVSFFHGLDREDDTLGHTSLKKEDDRTIHFNYYSKFKVSDYLDSIGYRGQYRILQVSPRPADTIVLINQISR